MCARLDPSPGAKKIDRLLDFTRHQERKRRKGASLAPAGPRKGPAGAEGVPFPAGSSGRNWISDLSFQPERRRSQHQQDPSEALLGREMRPFFSFSTRGGAPAWRESSSWLLLLVSGPLSGLARRCDPCIASSRLTGKGPTHQQEEPARRLSRCGCVNVMSYDSIYVNIGQCEAKGNLRVWHRVQFGLIYVIYGIGQVVCRNSAAIRCRSRAGPSPSNDIMFS